MSEARINSFKIKAKLLQKAKKKAGKSMALKDAFEMIATQAGFQSWRNLKEIVELHELFAPQGRTYWNTWYATYEEAKSHQASHGGFLMPYQKDFFICDMDYVESLGIDSNDPDLELVGTDWVKPKDEAAWQRLIQKMRNPKKRD